MADDDNPLWSGLFPNLLTAWNAPNVRPQGNPLASAVMTNPVGTQYAGPSMGMPQGPFDPIVGMGPNGVPITATQADAMRARTQAGADIATTAVLGMTGDAPGAKPPGFTAYHGSPHSFDAFDASKIGTGEGAQAYGHGLYVAGNEGVARNYQDALSNGGAGRAGYSPTPVAMIDGKPFEARNHEITQITQSSRDPAVVASKLQDYIDHAGPDNPYAHTADAQHVINAIQDGKYFNGIPGHMYEVQVNADPAHFLDWDKPLSEQSVAVSKVVQDAARHENFDPHEHLAVAQATGQHPRNPGASYQPTGQELMDDIAGIHGFHRNSAELAAHLRDAGIPGIRYLDGGSRASGEGTHNHVVFDANTMEILRKYGLAGLMAGGAAAATQAPQQ